MSLFCALHSPHFDSIRPVLTTCLARDVPPGPFPPHQAELPPQGEIPIGGIDGYLPYRATAQLIAASMNGPLPIQSLHQLRTPDLDKFLPPR